MLITRIITALILGSAVIVAVFFLPAVYAAAAFAILWVLGAWEWAALAGWQRGARVFYAALLLMAACLVVLLPGLSALTSTVAVIMALAWWAAAFIMVLRYPVHVPEPVVLLAGLPALIPSWVALAYLLAAPQGAALAFTALALVWSADVGAYAAGRTMGRVKLAPRVSPGKTWEGLAGGVLLAAIVGWVAALMMDWPVAPLIAIAVATALISVVGDLTVSVFKRQAGLKDTGTLLPGHGGVMDRIDSLVAALPVYLLGLKLAALLP